MRKLLNRIWNIVSSQLGASFWCLVSVYIAYLTSAEARGFIDGLLAKLPTKEAAFTFAGRLAVGIGPYLGAGLFFFWLRPFRITWLRSDQFVVAGPILGLRHRIAARSASFSVVKSVCSAFRLPDGSPYYELELLDTPRGDSKPLVVLKYRAKEGFYLPDLLDLRLLRELYQRGVRVAVLIVDLPYSADDVEVIASSALQTTRAIRRFLGGRPPVRALSALLSQHSADTIRWILDSYVPFLSRAGLAIGEFSRTDGDWDQSRAVSFLSVPLVARAIPWLGGERDHIVVVQWRDRHEKWAANIDIVGRGNSRSIGGFVLGESFPDPHGIKLVSAPGSAENSPMFTLSDSAAAVCAKILARSGSDWVIPDKYLILLGRQMLGSCLESTRRPGALSRLRLRIFLWWRARGRDLPIESLGPSLAMRRTFLREFTRIRRSLVRG